MTLLRVLHAEALKMKRTIALKMVVLSPALVVLLILFVASQEPFSTLKRSGNGNEWTALARSNLCFWALLMMPLYVTLETALLAGLDHSDNQWKSLLARPVPRWTLYVAKLIVVVAMTAASTLMLLCGILMAGAILPRLQPELVFGFPVPWAAIFRDGSQIMGLVFLALTIQHWGEFAMAVIFGRNRRRHRGDGSRLLRCRGGATGGWLAPILSLGASYASTGETASQHRSNPAYKQRLGSYCRGSRLFGFLQPRGELMRRRHRTDADDSALTLSWSFVDSRIR
jgi:hypothetical protein